MYKDVNFIKYPWKKVTKVDVRKSLIENEEEKDNEQNNISPLNQKTWREEDKTKLREGINLQKLRGIWNRLRGNLFFNRVNRFERVR